MVTASAIMLVLSIAWCALEASTLRRTSRRYHDPALWTMQTRSVRDVSEEM